MRGLMRAARWWFLAPALATAVIAAADGLLARPGTSDPAVLIQLGIPSLDANTYRDASLLRLDVLESAEPCGYGNVTLNDQTLDQDGHGRGSGSLMLEEGSTFVARWNFSCVVDDDIDAGGEEAPEQLMEVAVDLVDGKAVTGLNFAVRFKQTTPIRVLSVDGVPSVVTTPKRPAADQVDDEDDDDDDEPEASELRRLRAQLEHMTQQKMALEKAILEKQYAVGTKVAESYVKASTQLRKCHSPRCLVSTMYHKIKSAAGIAEDADESPIRIAFPDKDKERPLVATSDETRPQPQHVQYESHAQTSHRDASEAKWRRIKFFLLFVPAGVMVLVLAVVLGVKHAAAAAHHHSAAAAAPEDDAERQGRRRTRRQARRQAQAERRAALRAGFEELKRRLRERFALRRHSSIEDEEKDAIMRRVHAGNDGHDGHGGGGGGGGGDDVVGGGCGVNSDDSGSESDSDASSTTMEQELASFRNLADVVGSMVSSSSSAAVNAERRPRAPAMPMPRPPSPKYHHQPRRPGYAFSDCGSVDEELPSYDEGVIGASYVADGFRYSPGGRGPAWPGHPAAPPAAPSALDDVLGVKD